MTKESRIYLHQASDGQPFCSYDVPYTKIALLDTPSDTLSPLEYIENRFYLQDSSDELIEEIPDEHHRTVHPLEIGHLTYDDEEILDIEFDFDNLLGDTHG